MKQREVECPAGIEANLPGRAGAVASGSQRQSSMLELEFAQLSDLRRVREHNEDYLGHVVPDSPARARTHGWLFALADGVGGSDDGEVASRLAVETLLAGFRERCRRASRMRRCCRAWCRRPTHKCYETGLASRSAGRAMATTWWPARCATTA